MTAVAHSPKTEMFDLAAMTNTDPKGFVRDVEEYRAEPSALYMARPAPGRAEFSYIESWLIPELGLRISDFWYNHGHEREWDVYLDVVAIERTERRWFTHDLYLDIALRSGTDATVLDVDELLAATRAHHIELSTAQRALDIAFTTVDALAAHGYELDRWLAARDITLDWRRSNRSVGPTARRGRTRE